MLAYTFQFSASRIRLRWEGCSGRGLTAETSVLLIVPLVITSVRKLEALIADPELILVLPTSVPLTEPLAVVSPKEHVHWERHVAHIRAVVYAVNRDLQNLSISNISKLHGHLIPGDSDSITIGGSARPDGA